MNSDNDIENKTGLIEQEPSAREMMDCKRVFTRKNVPAPDVEEAWRLFGDKAGISAEVPKRKNRRTLFIGFAAGVAASVAILLGVYQLFIASHPVQVFEAAQSINGISLTNAAGKSLNLSNVDSADNTLLAQGVKANKDSLDYRSAKLDALPKVQTVTIPRGQDYQVVLSDGTKVWLNADSKLIFPDHFTGAKREVELEGEAYFEVAKDKAHPFVVNNKMFSTEVLGTKFNMKTYDASNASVVLIEGKVSLESKKSKTREVIIPGQKAQLTSAGKFNVQSVDTYSYTQWKDGYFYFNNVPLVDIMQELGRWYNVDIEIENPKTMHTRLHFVADRNQGLAAALKNLNAIGDVTATMNSNKVVVR